MRCKITVPLYTKDKYFSGFHLIVHIRYSVKTLYWRSLLHEYKEKSHKIERKEDGKIRKLIK